MVTREDKEGILRRHLSLINSEVISIRSPSCIDNADMSIPHRIQMILLRRGLLADYSNDDKGLANLLQGNKLKIKIKEIKEIALDMPVFLAVKPRGLGLTDSPMSSHTLSAFIKSRAAACGLITGLDSLEISLYAWRRHAGTKVDRTVGLDQARQFLHHSPTSDTFRKYYDSGISDFDLVLGRSLYFWKSGLNLIYFLLKFGP